MAYLITSPSLIKHRLNIASRKTSVHRDRLGGHHAQYPESLCTAPADLWSFDSHLHQYFVTSSGAVPGNPKHLSNQLARTAPTRKGVKHPTASADLGRRPDPRPRRAL